MRRLPRNLLASLSIGVLAAVAVTSVSIAAYAAATVGNTVTTPADQFLLHEVTATSPDGSMLAVPSYSNDTVTLIPQDDPAAFETLSDPLLKGPVGLVFSHDGSTLYVTNYDDPTVVLIDVATRTVTGTFATLNSENLGIALSPDGSTLVVSDDTAANNITAYSVNNSYSMGNPGTLLGTYALNLFYTDNSSVLAGSSDGVLERFSPGSAAVTTLATLDADRYWCANADFSILATAKSAAGGDDPKSLLIDPTDGSELSALEVETALDLTNCSFTNQGQLIWTDYNYSAASEGQVFVLGTQNNQQSFFERFRIPNVVEITGIGVMANCSALVTGYTQNIGVLNLDSAWCALAPHPGQDTTPKTLANTGGDANAGQLWLAAASLLLLAGFAAVSLRSRRSR